MRLIILSALILSGCATVQGNTPLSELSEQIKIEIMTDIAEHYGVEPIDPPTVLFSPEDMHNPKALCTVNVINAIEGVMLCRKEPPAYAYYHEAVHIYQFSYRMPTPVRTGCKRPKEFDAYILTASWCQRVGGCPDGVTNLTSEFLKERAECPK